MFYRLIVVFVILFLVNNINSQIKIENTKFISPLKIPLVLSGNFGELRPNHFHTGLDIKTGGVIGKKVVSIEDGYVYRIAYSHWGYGRVLYIAHPSGYISVYAHLSKFSTKINERVKEIEIECESESFNRYLDSNEIVVKKGEIIALSGTSGSSYAPHLHFEIREKESEHVMNPLLFGFKITDNVKPTVNGVKFYPLEENSTINGSHKDLYIKTTRISSGNHKLSKSVKAYGKIGLGIHTTDKLNGARNVCGVFNVDLHCNKELIFNHNMRFMDFNVNRYINHHMDYNEYTVVKRNIHKNYLKGNNKLPIYGAKVNNGILDVKTDSVYKIYYNIKDVYGNTSKLKFNISGDKQPKISKIKKSAHCVRDFKFDNENYFDTTNFTLLMAENTIYDDHCFSYATKKDSTLLSDIHLLNTKDIPVHHYFKLQIKPNKVFDSTNNSKLIVVEIDEKGNKINRKGSFINGTITTRVREYGNYAVSIDTVRPSISLRTNKKYLKTLKRTSKLEFKISDNLSGIDTYKAYLDDNWILSNYNRRNGRLKVNFRNASISKGNHTIKIVVTDERGNVKSREVVVKIL